MEASARGDERPRAGGKLSGARVAVDFSAGAGQGAGIGRYARHVLPNAIAALPDWRFALWYAPESAGGTPFLGEARRAMPEDDRVTYHRSPLDRRRMDQLWFRARIPLPIEAWTRRADLVYSPDFTAPPSLRRPTLCTVHDLAFAITPERAPSALRHYLAAVVPRQVEHAAAVIAVSETTKRDLVERLAIRPERVTVVPNAADERFFQGAPLSPQQRESIGLPERYILAVGTLEPRKNHLTLFAAVRRLPNRHRVPLAIVGRRGWAADEIAREAAALQADGLAVVLDYVDDALLPGLYAGAAVLAYPSWYEGFGLPVLEGLAAGIPVVASRVPAHVEVAGDQALLVDPASVNELAEALATVLDRVPSSDDERALRRSQAHRFSWQASGQALAQLFRRIAQR